MRQTRGTRLQKKWCSLRERSSSGVHITTSGTQHTYIHMCSTNYVCRLLQNYTSFIIWTQYIITHRILVDRTDRHKFARTDRLKFNLQHQQSNTEKPTRFNSTFTIVYPTINFYVATVILLAFLLHQKSLSAAADINLLLNDRYTFDSSTPITNRTYVVISSVLVPFYYYVAMILYDIQCRHFSSLTTTVDVCCVRLTRMLWREKTVSL